MDDPAQVCLHTRFSDWGRRLSARVPLVLVVDPNEDSRALMRLLFEQAGMLVAECEQGECMLDEITRLQPDLVIVEEWLPRVDGRTACRRLRDAAENVRHTPVIFVSSSASAAAARLAFEAGCTLYFIKPFDIAELMGAATELVTRARARAFA